MPESAGDIVRELLAQGMSRRQIGLSIDRNDRLIGAIAKGEKPGTNLRGALAALRDRVRAGGRPPRGKIVQGVPAAPRRQTKSGAEARVRRKGKIADGRIVRTKRQATRNGAKSVASAIQAAAAANMRMAFTLTFGPKARITQSDGTPIPPERGARTQELSSGGRGREGYPASMFADLIAENGGNATSALVQWCQDANRLQGAEVPLAIEVRFWFHE